jgi:hypothetical protein
MGKQAADRAAENEQSARRKQAAGRTTEDEESAKDMLKDKYNCHNIKLSCTTEIGNRTKYIGSPNLPDDANDIACKCSKE